MATFSERLSVFTRTRLCVLHDDVGEDRSVIVAPAHDITHEQVNFILANTGGLTFVALTEERAGAFMLEYMPRITRDEREPTGSAPLIQYTSVEAREGVTTGISAADRATTIRILGAESPQPRELVKPGHIFPVEARGGGVLVKASVSEAALDTVRLAGYTDAALFVDLLGSSGELLRREQAAAWAVTHKFPTISISELVQHRLHHEPLIRRLSEATIPTHTAGEVRAIAYSSSIHDVEHLAIVKGSLETTEPVLVRVQVEHTIADVFGGSTPASRQQITNSLRAISEHGRGVMLYLRRASLLDTPLFATGEVHLTTSSATAAATTMREYGVGAQILRDLGISSIELLSSTQRTLVGLDSFGITVARQRPIPEYTREGKESSQ